MSTQVQDIKAQDKQEVPTPKEHTTPGRVFAPRVDIFEDEEALTIIADMAGVQSENVSIDLREDVLTLSGVPSVTMPEKEEYILHEFETGRFFRQFTLSEVIDQANIRASLTNGVLRVTLPKVGPAKPRKIQITGG
jgi:HSP20 family molecular chaperone IbpA